MSSIIWSGSKTFTCTSGEESVIAIPAPHRGKLRGYTLVQINGAADGFDASLYSSQKTPEEIYHLINLTDMAEVTEDSDVVAIAENNVLEVAYQNRNGSPSLPERFLYLKITPAGTASKSFTLSVTVETPRL